MRASYKSNIVNGKKGRGGPKRAEFILGYYKERTDATMCVVKDSRFDKTGWDREYFIERIEVKENEPPE